MKPPLGPYDDCYTPQGNVKRTEADSYMIPLSRILFHNSKNIGKHRVSLVLVEALYAIKSLDMLVNSRVTRSNSIGSQTNLNSSVSSGKLQSHLRMAKVSQGYNDMSKTQQVLETSYVHSTQTGPTFVYRFYCRGENDTNAYMQSLEAALNDALLYFLSEYMTKIEPELYLKQIELSKSPAQFRKYGFNAIYHNKSYQRENTEKVKVKKRHKSTGNFRFLKFDFVLNTGWFLNFV